MSRAIRRYLAALINPDPAGKVRLYTRGSDVRNYVHIEYPKTERTWTATSVTIDSPWWDYDHTTTEDGDDDD